MREREKNAICETMTFGIENIAIGFNIRQQLPNRYEAFTY